VHGRVYFEALADELAATGEGDSVQFVGWRGDADELLTDDGPTVGEALRAAARRGAAVRGLLWRSHSELFGYHAGPNRRLARAVTEAGGEVLLDQRVLPLGSHHQKMVVIRHAGRPADDVAFIGGIDLDHGSRDDTDHRGDQQSVGADPFFGPNPAYHDVQLELHGPVVREAEEIFRERWSNPAALSRLPWHVIPDRIHGLRRTASPLPPALPDPPRAGTCVVQLLRTYPRRRPRYPYAPFGERSIALAYAKALSRAERLVYIEDQYLWSFDVARTFAAALQRAPRLHLIAVVPRRPDSENPFYLEAATMGHAEALGMVREAGGDRVQVLDIENHQGLPVYVHSKICIIDDVWAAVGSDNFNTRSWTHDSELTAAVLDSERDPREPTDPAGLGDGSRRYARELRLSILREHLDLDRDDDLIDPDSTAQIVRKSAAELDAWHEVGREGPRPPGRMRAHISSTEGQLPARHRWFTAPVYRSFLDPDGRPLGMRLRRTY
jgi:phosphatidylserine/phosphatidylglycerophosphate/cardiolipin synthase-like enzyme